MINRPVIILWVMIIFIVWGFVGIYLSVYGIAKNDFGIMVFGFISWIGFVVPRLLSENEQIDKWIDEYYNEFRRQ